MKLQPSRRVLCRPYNRAPCHFMQSHIRKVYVCLAVTCQLHFWQNDRDLLRATVVTRGGGTDTEIRVSTENRSSFFVSIALSPKSLKCHPCVLTLFLLHRFFAEIHQGEGIVSGWHSEVFDLTVLHNSVLKLVTPKCVRSVGERYRKKPQVNVEVLNVLTFFLNPEFFVEINLGACPCRASLISLHCNCV